MFSGQLEDVVLEFDRSLIGAVYDKFGENVKMLPAGERKCIATVKVRISPTFWGWIFQFGNQMTVIAPQTIVQQRQEYLHQLQN